MRAALRLPAARAVCFVSIARIGAHFNGASVAAGPDLCYNNPNYRQGRRAAARRKNGPGKRPGAAPAPHGSGSMEQGKKTIAQILLRRPLRGKAQEKAQRENPVYKDCYGKKIATRQVSGR